MKMNSLTNKIPDSFLKKEFMQRIRIFIGDSKSESASKNDSINSTVYFISDKIVENHFLKYHDVRIYVRESVWKWEKCFSLKSSFSIFPDGVGALRSRSTIAKSSTFWVYGPDTTFSYTSIFVFHVFVSLRIL